MNPGAVRERHSLRPPLYFGGTVKAQQFGNQAAGTVQRPSVDAGIHAKIVGARAQRHHHLLESGVTGTFADSVDRPFHLAGAVQHPGERIRHRQPQIVVAVNADGRPVRAAHLLPDAANQRAVLRGHGIAGGIGDIDDRSTGFNHRFQHLEEVARLRSPGIFGIELHIFDGLSCEFDGLDGHLEDSGLLLTQRPAIAVVLEFARDMDIRGADPRMDSRALRVRQRLAAGHDIGGNGARERTDGRSVNVACNKLDRLEILGRRGWIAGLDHVHVQLCQLSRDQELVTAPQTAPCSLFAVSQSGVENRYFFRHRIVPRVMYTPYRTPVGVRKRRLIRFGLTGPTGECCTRRAGARRR